MNELTLKDRKADIYAAYQIQQQELDRLHKQLKPKPTAKDLIKSFSSGMCSQGSPSSSSSGSIPQVVSDTELRAFGYPVPGQRRLTTNRGRVEPLTIGKDGVQFAPLPMFGSNAIFDAFPVQPNPNQRQK